MSFNKCRCNKLATKYKTKVPTNLIRKYFGLFFVAVIFAAFTAGCTTGSVLPDNYDNYLYPKTPYSQAHMNKDSIHPGILSKTKNPIVPLNLNDCLEIALQNNEGVILAGKGVEISKIQEDQAEIAWLPRFSVSGEYSYRNNDNETVSDNPFAGLEFDVGGNIITMPATMRTKMGTRHNAQGIAEMLFPIYLFGRIENNIDMRTFKVDSALADSRRTKQQIVYVVTQIYTSILEIKQNISVLKSSIKVLQSVLANITNFVDEGMATEADKLNVEIMLASREQDLLEVQSILKQAKYQLNSLLGLEISRDTKVEEISKLPGFSLEENAIVNLALSYRPEVFKMKAEYESAKAVHRLTKNNLWPMIYGFVNVTAASSEALVNNAWLNMGVRMQWNIFDSGETIASIKTAKVAKEMQELQAKLIFKQIIVEAKSAFEKLKNAESKLSVAQKRINYSELNLKNHNELFKEGLKKLTDVLEAETSLFDAQRAYWTNVYEIQREWAQLEFATGLKFDPEFVSKKQLVPSELATDPGMNIEKMYTKLLEKTE